MPSPESRASPSGDEQRVGESVGQLFCQRSKFSLARSSRRKHVPRPAEESVSEPELHAFDPVGEPGGGPVTIREEETGLTVSAGPWQESYAIDFLTHDAAPKQAWMSRVSRSTPYVASHRASRRSRWSRAFSSRSWAVR